MSEPRPRTARLSSLLAVTAVTSVGLFPATPAVAVAGPDAAAGAYRSAVKLSIGDEANSRACTGTLVDKLWVLTAASCFATVPGSPVPAGKPALDATATLSDGKSLAVVEIAPRTDRDAALVRLAVPAYGMQTTALAASAPAANATLTAAGFGRTKTEWVTDKLHTGSFTVDSTTAGELNITGKGADSICKGDTGGPLLNAAGEIVGVNSRSWQGGCLGTDATETRTGAISARVDGLGSWIGTLTSRRSAAVNEAGGNGRIRWADFDGDRKPDYFNIDDNGSVSVWLNRGGNPAGANGWQGLGKVANGLTTDRNRVRFADFDGDGKADYFLINTDGSVEVYLNQGGDPAGANGWKHIGKVTVGVTNDPSKVRFADWDGDGRSDYIAFSDSGSVHPYLNRGGDQSGNGWPAVGQVAAGVTNDRSRIRFADNDGDGKADYLHVKPDGKVDLYVNRGGDVVPNGWQVVGQIASGVTTDHTKVQFADFDGDTRADYIVAGDGNSASVWLWNGGDQSGANGWKGIGVVASGT
ncbi:FG-GAP-like repeat-containing protein [Streptomyces nojiriensis]|uniref:FG-GAP-like repeat-containing protein n=1 Tax=Streptomyces nojiriensis TaxID=66374 RepID=UPI0036DE616B